MSTYNIGTLHAYHPNVNDTEVKYCMMIFPKLNRYYTYAGHWYYIYIVHRPPYQVLANPLGGWQKKKGKWVCAIVRMHVIPRSWLAISLISSIKRRLSRSSYANVYKQVLCMYSLLSYVLPATYQFFQVASLVCQCAYVTYTVIPIEKYTFSLMFRWNPYYYKYWNIQRESENRFNVYSNGNGSRNYTESQDVYTISLFHAIWTPIQRA